MDQRALAEAIGVHPKTVSRWENNSQPPEHDALEAAAGALGVSVDWLKSGDLAAREPEARYGKSAAFPQRARAFINRFMAELADAGVSEEDEAWARRVLSNPDNVGFSVGGSAPTLDESAMLRDMEGMSIGVRLVLIKRGYKNLAAK
jgi:transcriptional regulator with XRE-family HTH domain